MQTSSQIQRHTFNKQRGISLVEIAIAVALVAGLIVGVMSWVKRIELDKQLTATRIDAVKSINAAVAAYSEFASTSGANPQILSSQAVWPAERMNNPGTANVQILGNFKGSQEFMWANTWTLGTYAGNTGFVYHITKIPKDGCAQLVTSLANIRNVYQIYAGDFAANPSNGGVPALTLVKNSDTLALNMTSLATACGAGNQLKHIAIAFFKA